MLVEFPVESLKKQLFDEILINLSWFCLFSDGCGRSGTYCLIDMVLNKMAKGAKEIDMAATLEHIRDQRMSLVETKVRGYVTVLVMSRSW